MNKKYILLFFVVWTTSSLLAQDHLTFEKAMSLALEQNTSIIVARNNAAIAEKNVNIGGAGLLPRIDVSGSANYSDAQLPGAAADASTTTSAQISASYTIFDGLGNIYRFKKLQAEGKLGQLQARELIEGTLLNVSQAYYSAASASENLTIARELLTISRERLARARNRQTYGQANTIDVLSAQVDFNTDSVTVIQAMLRWEEARRNLNGLLGQNIRTDYIVDREVVFRSPQTMDELQSQALKNNAGYRASAQSVRKAQAGLAVARAAHLPRVDLTTSYGYNQTASDFGIGLDDPGKTWRVGATVSMNLFNGFQTHIQRQNAQLTLSSERAEEAQARLDLERDVTNAFESYMNSRTVLALEEENLEAAELNFMRTEELYQLGQVTNTQFREAQLNLIRAKSSISEAKYDAKLNEIDLLRIVGGVIGEVDES